MQRGDLDAHLAGSAASRFEALVGKGIRPVRGRSPADATRWRCHPTGRAPAFEQSASCSVSAARRHAQFDLGPAHACMRQRKSMFRHGHVIERVGLEDHRIPRLAGCSRVTSRR